MWAFAITCRPSSRPLTFHILIFSSETHLKFDIFSDIYRQNRGENKLTRGSSQVNLTLIETDTCTGIFCHSQCFYNLLTSPLFYQFLRCLYMLRCQKIGLWRNFMWTFRMILKFKNGVSKYACTRVYVSIKVRFTGLSKCSPSITKVIIFWLENGKFEFSRKQYIFLKHSKREFCAKFYYHFKNMHFI
jgi:hypothetical protein